MYSKIVLNLFNNPKNAGRIKKPDGIADCYNYNGTAHVEFSLKIENGIIELAQFRAQANPYIIAVCSTITQMLKGKMVSMVFLDPYSIQKELGEESETDIMFCIDCVKMAIDDYKDKLDKENKQNKKKATLNEEMQIPTLENELYDEFGLGLDDEFEVTNLTQSNEQFKQTPETEVDFKDDFDDDFADFFDDLFEED